MTVTSVVEQIIDLLHCCDAEAQTIANRIAGARGMPNRCPDGVQVLEDAETIIRAATAILIGGHGETQDVEYIRRDPAVLAALPEVQALIAANYRKLVAEITGNPSGTKCDACRACGYYHCADAFYGCPGMRDYTPADATAALARIEREAEAMGMRKAAARARVYASNYEQSSDGRNTFILLAEWADTEAAAILARADQIEKDGK